MRVLVHISLKSAVLDPQGKAVSEALQRLGFDEVVDARVGRTVELALDGADAGQRVEQMCDRLLANPVIEDYRVEVISE